MMIYEKKVTINTQLIMHPKDPEKTLDDQKEMIQG
jgi:hypothetical protein